jgi:lipopolysaccharide/colanic/teichoic acid biosynthesis glycosyltransferase
MLKRLLDIAVSLPALIFLSVPFLVVMLILRLTGEGHVVYRQPRIGQGGRTFLVYKFVTMIENSEQMSPGDITLPDDPRVLPVGRILRKTKINELPQLINVLRGEMSIVGWRPMGEESFAMYPTHVQQQIVHAKPGLTGIGSIVFRDEEQLVQNSTLDAYQVHTRYIAPYKGELELWYQRHQSLWVDIKIIVATAFVLLFSRSEVYRGWFPGLPAREDIEKAPRAQRIAREDKSSIG